MTNIKFVFEDEYIFALNKPSGLHSVNTPKSRDSVAQFVLNKSPSAGKISLKPEDAGLVNRLDFETSGLLLGAKSREVWLDLHRMFKENRIEKTYLAVVDGKARDEEIVETFIGSTGRRSPRVKVFVRKPPAKYRALPAISEFKLLNYSKASDKSLVEVKLITGRRHQIRAHAGYLKMPLAGDKLYGSKSEPAKFILHASRLSFIHPVTGKKLKIESPISIPEFRY